MAVQLFRLRNVPDDEAEEVRQLLSEHQIDFYETPAGNWGMSMPALWLKDESQYRKAKSLLDDYQQQRQASAQQNKPQQPLWSALWYRFIENPVQFIAYMVLVIAIIYISLMPFFDLGH